MPLVLPRLTDKIKRISLCTVQRRNRVSNIRRDTSPPHDKELERLKAVLSIGRDQDHDGGVPLQVLKVDIRAEFDQDLDGVQGGFEEKTGQVECSVTGLGARFVDGVVRSTVVEVVVEGGDIAHEWTQINRCLGWVSRAVGFHGQTLVRKVLARF